MATKLPSRLEMVALLGVLCVVGVLVGIWVYATRPEKASESNRVIHTAGFSIIRPAGWDFTVRADATGEGSSIRLLPHTYKGHLPSITVTRLGKIPPKESYESASYRSDTFQGEPAMMLDMQKKNLRQLRVAFQRGDAWYEIAVTLPDWEGARAAEYWQYINSFRLETPVKVFTPATQFAPLALPATVPVNP